MALKKYYYGDQGPFFVDTAKNLHDPDGDFPGQLQAGFVTNAPIVGISFQGYLVSTLEVTDIDDPSTELNAENADSIGAMVYCYETAAGAIDEFTLYLWDTNFGTENPPFSVDGSSGGGWVAVGGKYQATPKTFGEQVNLAGDGRVVQEVELTAAKFAPGVSGADRVKIGNFDGWQFDINDDMIADFEIPHNWDSTVDIEVRIYWCIDEAYATNSGEVQWLISWSAVPVNGTEAIDSPTHTGSIDFGDQNIPATAKYLTTTAYGTIAASSLSAGDMVGLDISRVALDDGSNPTADPIMIRVEVEITVNKLGEPV